MVYMYHSFLIPSSANVYYQGWNRSPAQVGCMRQVLGAGALGRPRGMGWRGRREGWSGWGIHVNPWLIHVNLWQKPLQYCKVISRQLVKINEKKKKKNGQDLWNEDFAVPLGAGPFYWLFMIQSCWNHFWSSLPSGFPGLPGLHGLNGLPGTKGTHGTPGKQDPVRQGEHQFFQKPDGADLEF